MKLSSAEVALQWERLCAELFRASASGTGRAVAARPYLTGWKLVWKQQGESSPALEMLWDL